MLDKQIMKNQENNSASTQDWLEAIRGMTISSFVEDRVAKITNVWPFTSTSEGAVGTISLTALQLS